MVLWKDKVDKLLATVTKDRSESTGVQSVVGELRSYKLHGAVKRKRKNLPIIIQPENRTCQYFGIVSFSISSLCKHILLKLAWDYTVYIQHCIIPFYSKLCYSNFCIIIEKFILITICILSNIWKYHELFNNTPSVIQLFLFFHPYK